ncbi:MAG: hypothetical protein ACFFCS_02990 [Candidatus Hodarchaeota archaeon]
MEDRNLEQRYQNEEDNRQTSEMKAKIIDMMKQVRTKLKRGEIESAATCLRELTRLCRMQKN